MRILFRLGFLVVLVIWIVYAKDFLLPYFQTQLGEFVGYIANGLAIFIGGWFMWRVLSRGKLL